MTTPYQPTVAELKKAMERLKVFKGRLGYPANMEALLMAATLFARIVHFKPPTEICSPVSEALVGVADDSLWLAEQVFEQFDRFPTMQKFREVYRNHLPPRYAREDVDL
jgi:hypothetical protein